MILIFLVLNDYFLQVQTINSKFLYKYLYFILLFILAVLYLYQNLLPKQAAIPKIILHSDCSARYVLLRYCISAIFTILQKKYFCHYQIDIDTLYLGHRNVYYCIGIHVRLNVILILHNLATNIHVCLVVGFSQR